MSPREKRHKSFRSRRKHFRFWDKDGKIHTVRTPAGHRRYDIDSVISPGGDTRIRILYARVSSYKQKSDLERQADYLQSLFTDGKLGHCKSDQVSTTNEKDFYPFWNKSCQEMSEKLWSATKTDLSGKVKTLSNGSVNKKIANSWFSTEVTYLQNEKWLRISLPSSSMSSVADSTDSESTNLLSKKIRVYPETALAKTWYQWISAARWCFNQAIAILKKQKIGKYDLRKTVMNMAPSWVTKTPYNPRQLAVFQAYEAHKAARKSGGDAKFRSVRTPVKSIRFQKDNWKKGTFYPTQTKGLRFKASEPIIDKMHHEPTLVLDRGRWFICYAIEAPLPEPLDSCLAIALDPGVRTFIMGCQICCGFIRRSSN